MAMNTKSACWKCGVTPRMFWPSHPEFCRDCMKKVMPQGSTMGLPVAVQEARATLRREVGQLLTKTTRAGSRFMTNQPCIGCGKAPRVRWPRHPDRCRDCVGHVIGGGPKTRAGIPPLAPRFEAPEAADRGIQAGTVSEPVPVPKPRLRAPEPPKRGIRRSPNPSLPEMSVEEIRRRAAALFGTYRPD